MVMKTKPPIKNWRLGFFKQQAATFKQQNTLLL